MFKKIKLNRGKAIVFMGSMNAMPMMYALELKKLNYEVIYFVDVSKEKTLSRPENHFPDIDYPYPFWVVEWILPSQIFVALFPRLFAFLLEKKIKKLTHKEIGCFVLNGFFCSLPPYLSQRSNKIALSHGSDLDVWANIEDSDVLVKSFKNRSIFKFLPKLISGILIKSIVKTQYNGFAHSDAVLYFPAGFNVEGDKVISKLIDSGVKYIPRYDISFEPLKGQSREFRSPSEKLQIFSGVRFLFKTFPDGNTGYNKGNDIIIEGIAKYFTINKNICVHFVEKGEDVQYAKELCAQLGITDVVVWHKEMPFKQLLQLYQNSDICFDQLGNNWIAAIGGYALWLGKPLIANDDPAVRSGVWPDHNPICSAKVSDDVLQWLVKLDDIEIRKMISEESKGFVETYMSPIKALKCIFDVQSNID